MTVSFKFLYKNIKTNNNLFHKLGRILLTGKKNILKSKLVELQQESLSATKKYSRYENNLYFKKYI